MKKRTKVALLKDRIGRQGGGLEKYARRLAEAFSSNGHEVTILTMGSPSEHLFSQESHSRSSPVYPQGVCRIVNLGTRLPLGIANIWQFNRLCQKWLAENPQDVVFGMDRTTWQTHYRAGNGIHAAYLDRRKKSEGLLERVSFAINPLHQIILKYEKQAFEAPDLRVLFTNSDMVKKELLSYYRTDPNKVKVVHNGVEWNEWQQPFDCWVEQRPQILQTLGLDPGSFQLLFVGHGFRRKGLHHLLQGMAALKNRDIQLSVVGKDKNLSQFQQLVQQLGLASQVKFFGERHDVIAFYQAADALAIPSTYDPFANVTLEALAMGLFVVSSRDNGGHEVLSPLSGTLIANPATPETVAASLSIALQHPKTAITSQAIRQTAKPYDFTTQLNTIVTTTLAT